MVSKTGCEFGRINRLRIEEMQKNHQEIIGMLGAMKTKEEEMFNHFTEKYDKMFEKMREKVPQWVVIFIGLMGALIGGLAVWTLTHK